MQKAFPSTVLFDKKEFFVVVKLHVVGGPK